MKVIEARSLWLKESDLRFDSKYYLGEGRLTRMLMDLSSLGTKTIRDHTEKIFYGGRARRIYVKKASHGIPYMGGASMLKSDFNDLKYISKKHTKALDEYMLKENWTLISRSGTVGKTVFTNRDFINKAGSDDVIRLIPNSKTKPGLLYAYLSSKFGYALITQGAFGAVIQHVEPEFISELPIPNFHKKIQEKVDGLMLNSAQLKEKSTAELALAHKLIEVNVFKTAETDSPRIDICDSGSIFRLLHSRLDSTFYLNLIPIENALRENVRFKTLKDLVQQPMFTAQRGKRVYVKNGIKFLSTTDISQSNPLRIDKYLSLKTNGLNSLIVKKNWILVSSSGQEILGSSFLVDDTYHECAVNQHSIRVIIDEEKISPHYVYGFLSHPKIKDYLRAGIYGSAILTINEDYLNMIKIPVLSKNLTDRISQHVLSHQKYKEDSCKLEYEAIALLEKEIESWQK